MKRLHRRRPSIVRPAGLLALVAIVLAAACGTGTPQLDAATTSPTTTSPTTSPVTPSVASVQVVPARVLRNAIATTGLGGAYKVTFSGALEGEAPGGMDLSTMGDFVSGGPGCAAMFKPHSQAFGSAAVVLMETKAVGLAVQAESYETPEQAKKVMAENHKQAKGCTTFTMRVHVGERHETATVLFGSVSGLGGDNDTEWFTARFLARSGYVTYDLETYELRIGGEMLHIESYLSDPKSAAQALQALQAHFEKVITTYRSTHPRPSDS